MDYVPMHMTTEQVAAQRIFPPTRGTEICAASLPRRREMLDNYDGYVYLDLDAAIVRGDEDIRQFATWAKPISMIDLCNGAVVVVKSTRVSKLFYDTMWRDVDRWRNHFWAEEAGWKEMLGRPFIYPGAGAPDETWRKETPWSRYLNVLPVEWNCHPGDVVKGIIPAAEVRITNPGGVWPFSTRLKMVRHWTDVGRQNMGRW